MLGDILGGGVFHSLAEWPLNLVVVIAVQSTDSGGYFAHFDHEFV